MPDKILICSDCGTQFTFTESEQAFYKEKGFDEPKRCPACRKLKKQQRENYSDRNDRY